MSQAVAIPAVGPGVMYATLPETLMANTARTWTGKYMEISQNLTDLLPWADSLQVMLGFSDLPPVAVPTEAPKVVDLFVAKFKKRVAEWKASKGALSSVSALAMLPPYQQIIGMGERAVPLILNQLQSEGDQPDMWFWALKAITEVDPVSDDDRGDFVAMAAAWLKWGRQNSVS